MEHRTEKAELPKRRVFREHIILLIEGRLLMLLFIGFTGFIWYLFFRDTPSLLNKVILFPLCVTALICIPLHEFWYRCFGHLVVTEDEIIWKCPFMRTVRLKKAEIRYTGIDYRWPGPARKAVTPVDMAYFSTTPYPQECRNKSYLLRNKEGFIKFPASEKLCRHMSEWLPEPYERVFAAASNGYEAQRRQRARRRAEKQRKRRRN